MDSLENLLIFRIHYKTAFGENLFVSGNIPELGSWDVTKSIKLSWITVRIYRTIIQNFRMIIGSAKY